MTTKGREATPLPLVYVGTALRKGRGCFARRAILAGEIIERAPAIVLPPDGPIAAQVTELDAYAFDWPSAGPGACAIVLGYGSLYNHSYTPNAVYVRDHEHAELTVVALRDIAAGEEVVFNYNRIPDDRDPVWFEVES